jgi:hypothetical protein
MVLMFMRPPLMNRFTTITLWHFDAGCGRRPPHHSRMRELVFGGLTRHIARHMTVPTLLSH